MSSQSAAAASELPVVPVVETDMAAIAVQAPAPPEMAAIVVHAPETGLVSTVPPEPKKRKRDTNETANNAETSHDIVMDEDDSSIFGTGDY
jgi:hypothetical protein